MAETRAQDYKQKLDALVTAAGTLSPEVERRVHVLLEEALREILADLALAKPKSYNTARLLALKAQVERVMQEFSRKAAAQVNALEVKSYQMAALGVDAAVSAGTGRLAVQPVVDQAMLRVVQGYTADLITGLSTDAAAKINAAIQRAYLGGANLSELVEQIGSALEDGKFSGLFSQVGERAMTIATNEIMRVHSLASVARINDLAPHHPGLKKRWLHIPAARVPRVTHIAASGQVREPDKPFEVGGEWLRYPRDPAGSPGNTINCHCLVQPYLSAEDLKPTDAERSLLKSYGISVTTA